MTAQGSKAPQGEALKFSNDHTPLVLMIRGNSTPMAALREALVNSLQGDRSRKRRSGSGATKIDILPGRGERSTIIRDNGPGMAPEEMAEFLTTIFAGKKDRVKQANQGAGIKTVGPAHNPSGVVITSWKDRSTAYQVFLYLEEDSDGRAVYKFKTGSDSQPVTRVSIPKNATSQTGTQVELMDLEFHPYEIMKYLNRRFAHFKTPDAPQGVDVRVHRAAGQMGAYEDKVLGYEACLRRISREDDCGRVSIGGSNPISFWWAIRDSSPERKTTNERFCSDYFQPPCLGISFQDEMYEFTSAGRAATVLTGYGIRAGGLDVVLVIDVDGSSEVTPNISRTSLGDNVDRDELKERVRENLPQRLIDYMDEFEARHFNERVDTVAETLTRMFAAPMYLAPASDVISPVDPEKREGKGEETAEREPSKKRRRRKNRSRGYPRTVFVDAAQLGSLMVHYDEVNHVIQINQDHPRMKGLLVRIEDCPKSYSRSWLRTEVLGHIAGQASAAFNNLAHDRDEEPQDEDLASALGVFPGAILFLSNPNKYKLGKPKKE